MKIHGPERDQAEHLVHVDPRSSSAATVGNVSYGAAISYFMDYMHNTAAATPWRAREAKRAVSEQGCSLTSASQSGLGRRNRWKRVSQRRIVGVTRSGTRPNSVRIERTPITTAANAHNVVVNQWGMRNSAVATAPATGSRRAASLRLAADQRNPVRRRTMR